MESTTSNALILLTIGMITVFVVLLLVVLAGKLLIQLVNRYGQEPAVDIPASLPLVNNSRAKHSTQPAIIAAIAAAVDHATGGRGRITSINKLNQ
jgi:Na+-transporting methylmalonyl-CoA/oxaloacetate decarboxylase gamma subunit